MGERRTVQTRDVALSVRVDGEAGKPWLLLSNSLATDLSMWAPQIAALSPHRQIVRYDTRGHGTSSSPTGPYSFDALVADMVAILDALEIESADVMGLSLGGTSALALALAHPGRVSRLVCCCARGEYPPPALAAWDQRIAAVSQAGIEAIVEETLARWFTPESLAKRPQLATQARSMMRATSRAGYVGCVQALKTADFVRRLPSLTPPTLFIAGERDAAAPPEVIAQMAAAARAELRVVPGAAHIANMESPETFNTLALAFLRA